MCCYLVICDWLVSKNFNVNVEKYGNTQHALLKKNVIYKYVSDNWTKCIYIY